MDINKSLSTAATTASHKDPARAGVGTTAFGAALGRALASRTHYQPPLVRDPVACKLFGIRTRPRGVPMVFCVLFTLWCWMPLTWPLFYVAKLLSKDIFKVADMIGMRTRFIDDIISEAVDKQSIAQVVILGAGLDARACRLSCLHPTCSDTTVFEIDFRGMINAKRDIFTQVGSGSVYADTFEGGRAVVAVATDFSGPADWKADLLAAGFDSSEPCVWVLEGLTGYLRLNELQVCFETLTALSAMGSQLAATWNGESARLSPAPWSQSIHVTCIDDPDPLLCSNGWMRRQHMSIGAAAGVYGADKHIDAADRSYWLSHYEMKP